MVDPSAPAAPERRKRVLVPLAGKSQLDANRRLFEWCSVNLVDDADDVFVFHFTRAKKTGVSALRAAATQRPGVRVINIDAGEDTERETEAEKKRHEEKRRASADAEWLPRDVSDALRKRRAACPSSVVTVFEVDLDSGFNTAEVRDARGPTALRASGETTTTETRARGSDPSDEATRIVVPFASRERELAGRTLKPSDAPDAQISRSKRHAGNHLRGMRGCVRDASRRCAGGGANPTTRPRVRRESRPKVSQTRRARFRVQRRARRRLRAVLRVPVHAAFAVRRRDRRAPETPGGRTAPTRGVSRAERLGRVAFRRGVVDEAVASPVRSRRHPSLRRRQENETTTSDDAHVSANLASCEETVRAFMTAHPDPRGATQLFRLEESPDLSSDVRDRLVDFLDKTDVSLLVLGRSNRVGGFRTWTVGTVPTYAVQHGKCPVLVVNPTTEGAGADAAAKANRRRRRGGARSVTTRANANQPLK